MYQYNEFGNNNDNIWQKLLLGAGIAIVVAIIVGAKTLFEYLFY